MSATTNYAEYGLKKKTLMKSLLRKEKLPFQWFTADATRSVYQGEPFVVLTRSLGPIQEITRDAMARGKRGCGSLGGMWAELNTEAYDTIASALVDGLSDMWKARDRPVCVGIYDFFLDDKSGDSDTPCKLIVRCACFPRERVMPTWLLHEKTASDTSA